MNRVWQHLTAAVLYFCANQNVIIEANLAEIQRELVTAHPGPCLDPPLGGPIVSRKWTCARRALDEPLAHWLTGRRKHL